MANAYSMDELLEFLNLASDRGLMPSATTMALSVAVRNVFGVLTEDERKNLDSIDLASAVKRFTTKRAREFSPGSLKEYGRRVQRAVELYQQWRNDPSNFSVKTKVTKSVARKPRWSGVEELQPASVTEPAGIESAAPTRNGGYTSSISIRANWIVTLSNIPGDLSAAEAERIAVFVRHLAVTN